MPAFGHSNDCAKYVFLRPGEGRLFERSPSSRTVKHWASRCPFRNIQTFLATGRDPARQFRRTPMTRQYWTCIVAAMAGGVAAGAMGLSWLNAPPPGSSWSMTTGAGTGYVLLASLAAACIGALLVLQDRGKVASIVLCSAGLLPGLVEPRAFVATFLLVFAGLLTSSLPKRAPARPRTQTRFSAGSSSQRVTRHPSRA